ncbi:MAG: threonine/serine exporter family protein [Planctomycetota bacterium]
MARKRPILIQRAEPAADDPRARFLIEMARALGTYNVAAHRLEEAIQQAARSLRIRAQTFSTPTSVFISIEIRNHRETHLARVDPQAPDLAKIVALDEVLSHVIAGRVTPAKGTRLVKRVVRRRQRYGAGLQLAAHVVTAGCVARFFGGGWSEVIGASVIGLAVGALAVIASSHRHAARLLECFAGIFAAVLAAVFSSAFGGLALELTTIAGLIALMPGMTITTAMSELATRNLVSGTARFVGAVVIVFSIGFGVAVGNALGANIPGVTDAAPTPAPAWSEAAAVIIAPMGFVVLFNARLRDAWIMTLAGVLSYVLARSATAWVGTEFAVCLVATVIGVVGNLYARFGGRPASVVILPGILMMVPGSLSFRSFEFFLAEDTLTGTQTAFRVLFTALALVAGLLFANVAAAPKRPL